MIDPFKISLGVLLILVSAFLIGVSSPHYVAVLSISGASAGIAAGVFFSSSRGSDGFKRSLLRLSSAAAIAMAIYSVWGAVEAALWSTR
jgi:hypothetical protein